VLLYDVSRETWNRFTDEGNIVFALWTPGGNRLTLVSRHDNRFNVYTSPFDGSQREELVKDAPTIYPMSWSADESRTFLNSKFREGAPTFSPHGRWIEYVSDKSGRNEIYMRPFEGSGEEWTISTDGGNEPVWARNAPLLFYRHDDAMMVVDVVTTPVVSAGQATPPVREALSAKPGILAQLRRDGRRQTAPDDQACGADRAHPHQRRAQLVY
jgi:Tol biopolymer transport system component